MDYQKPPDIVITQTEHHNVKEETIEHVARLLARAAGADPDADGRCNKPKPGDTSFMCTLQAWPYPEYLVWNRYREQAEKLLHDVFRDGN